jgi:hypothetical protein
MPETLVENQICKTCGAEVRKGALFCYHCGGSVAPEISGVDNQKTSVTSRLKDNVNEAYSKKEVSEPIEKVSETKVETLEQKPEQKDFKIEKQNVIEDAKLKSAASMRRQAKTFQSKKTEEVVWAGYENAPNGWFIFVALFLTAVAVLIFLLAIYWK